MPRWSVDIIRHRAEHLGTVVAANEKDAIKVAIATFEIDPARRNRITLTKILGLGFAFRQSRRKVSFA
jgi:hypothetical protein